jgi:hypothetical protein
LVTFLCGTVEHGSKRTRISSIDKFLYELHFWITKGRDALFSASMFHDAYRHCRKRPYFQNCPPKMQVYPDRL